MRMNAYYIYIYISDRCYIPELSQNESRKQPLKFQRITECKVKLINGVAGLTMVMCDDASAFLESDWLKC